MKLDLEKLRPVIDEALLRSFSAAAGQFSLPIDSVREEIYRAVDKHFSKIQNNPSAAEIRQFIETLNAGDLCLVLACRAGKESAWEELFQRFQPVVKAAAARLAYNQDMAEEITSSIWSELYGLKADAMGRKTGKLAYYSGRGSLASWLRAVIAQMAVDKFRENSRFVQFSDESQNDSLAETNSADIVSTTPNPEQEFAEKHSADQVVSAVVSALEKLSDEDRLFLKMYYFDNLKLKEIGRILGFHEATASRRLIRIQTEIRRSAERILQSDFGWNENEIRTQLSETAARISPNLEKIIVGAILLVILQGFYW